MNELVDEPVQPLPRLGHAPEHDREWLRLKPLDARTLRPQRALPQEIGLQVQHPKSLHKPVISRVTLRLCNSCGVGCAAAAQMGQKPHAAAQVLRARPVPPAQELQAYEDHAGDERHADGRPALRVGEVRLQLAYALGILRQGESLLIIQLLDLILGEAALASVLGERRQGRQAALPVETLPLVCRSQSEGGVKHSGLVEYSPHEERIPEGLMAGALQLLDGAAAEPFEIAVLCIGGVLAAEQGERILPDDGAGDAIAAGGRLLRVLVMVDG